MQGGQPVEHLDRRGHRHQKGQDREQQAGIERLAGHEHVVAPDEEADHGDGDTRPGDEFVAEHRLARIGRHQLGDHAQARQDHHIDGRVRVEPEQMLEQQRIAADGGVEQPDMKQIFQHQQDQQHGQHRGRQQQDQAGGVERPQEQRQPVPGQARRPQPVDGDHEIEARRDRGKTRNEDTDRHRHQMAVAEGGRKRRIEGPAGIDPARHHAVERHQSADHEQIPAHQIEAGKGQVARPDHQRHDEITHRHRDRRHQEEPHHDDAMHGHHAVIGLGRQEGAGGGQEIEPNRRRRRPAEEKEQGDGGQIQERYALVIDGQQPGADGPAIGEVVQRPPPSDLI